jgi:PAS domain S-box-containing protein
MTGMARGRLTGRCTRTLRAYWWTVAVVTGALQVVTIGLFALGVVLFTLGGGRAADLRGQQREAAAVRQGVLEQGSALTAFAGTGDPRRLAPYAPGRQRTESALGLLTRATAGAPAAAPVARLAAAAEAWQAWGDEVRQAVAGTPGWRMDAAIVQAGQGLLDEVGSAETAVADLLGAAAASAESKAQLAWKLALAGLGTGTVAVCVVLGAGVSRGYARSVLPAPELAAVAREIARGAHPRIPRVEQADEFGELARGLQAWQSASAEREVVLLQAPLGICRVDTSGLLTTANPALRSLLRLPPRGSLDTPFSQLLHPDDRTRLSALLLSLAAGDLRAQMDARLLRSDGSTVWCSTVLAPLRLPGGSSLDGFIAIVEDIGLRRQQLDRAARIQRDLLPRSTPVLHGYDLAGACRPAQDVAGDFYDWLLLDDGRLDLTLADVMGRGIAAGLVMATLRAVLRAAPSELSPAARVALAQELVALGSQEEGLFVTLFHARLEPASGLLRYVDAGHGHCAVRRASGLLERLPARSLPLGVLPGTVFAEGIVHLAEGDTLLVHSDGLIERPDRTIDLSELAPILAAPDAADLVGRLMRSLPPHTIDDITLLALRRAQPEPSGPAVRPGR